MKRFKDLLRYQDQKRDQLDENIIRKGHAAAKASQHNSRASKLAQIASSAKQHAQKAAQASDATQSNKETAHALEKLSDAFLIFSQMSVDHIQISFVSALLAEDIQREVLEALKKHERTKR